jgi:uncharacterized protein
MTINENLKKPFVLVAGLIVATIIGGIFYLSGRTTGSRQLTVTGSARMSVVADNVVWRLAIQRDTVRRDLAQGYVQINQDRERLTAFLTENGITAAEIEIQPVSAMQDWSGDQNVPIESRRFSVSQSFTIRSSNVQGVTDLTQKITGLVSSGVLLSNNSVEYYYSKLPEARVSLLTDAVTDARDRAAAMAKSTKQSVGALMSASSGVVQVLSKGSVEVSDYGAYDTSTIEKEIMVPVRATFRLR